MAHTFAHKVATDVKFRMTVLFIGVAISVPVGLVTGELSDANLVVSTFLIVVGLCGLWAERSANRQSRRVDSN